MEPWLPEFTRRVEAALGTAVTDKDSLHKHKHRLAKELAVPRLPQDPELLPLLSHAAQESWGPLFRKKPMRSQSGVAVVAVMSSPAACPHGKCVYCPGGPDVDAPQSYTGFEPSTMRARRYDYEPYRIVRTRLAGLRRNGHAIDKVEIIVQGGTFPARDAAYQDWFIAGVYAACNDGPGADSPWQDLETWTAMEKAARHDALATLIQANEQATCRVIGLTIETKPDWCLGPHIDTMLRHGATRIELGVQALDEEVTRLTNRGHTVQDAADAMRIARDAGFKLCVHLMPGLPRPDGGAYRTDPDADREDVRRMFQEDDWKPDMLKIYPTLIVQEGETTLKRWWKEGRFTPLDTAAAVDIIADALEHVPPWCRIQRIDRDIPTTHVLAGVQNSNLRQLAEAEALRRGVRLRDIRAREAGSRQREGVAVDPQRLCLVRRAYTAAGGHETFLSFEDPEADAIVGFLRLRRPGASHRSEFRHPRGVAVIRELKVYGVAQPLGANGDEAGTWQHHGLGARLVAEAEAEACQAGVGRVLVIAGPGVKEYYRRLGYTDLGPYVAKEMDS